MEQPQCSRLSVCGLGVGIGFAWSLGMLVLGMCAMFSEYGTAWVQLMGSVYIGFKASWLGVVLGVLWGFFDGFIGGVLIALGYNWSVGRKCCPTHTK